MTYQEMVDHVFKRHARIRNLDIRLEELRWVDHQINFPSEVEPALSERIEYYEQELRKAVLGGDDAKS